MTLVSRRTFAASAALAPAVASLGLSQTALADTSEPGEWDAAYDVVVVGLGLAGASAAIEAADAGARVLVVEKCDSDHAGGCSRYAGQDIMLVNEGDRDAVVRYLADSRGFYDTPTDEALEQFVDGIIDAKSWVEAHGGNPIQTSEKTGRNHAVEGWELLGFWDHNGLHGNAGLYQLFCDIVASYDTVDVWFESPAEELIQNGDGAVEGVVVSVEGAQRRVRAASVILASGGFEANQQMTRDFVGLPYCFALGGFFNTGDGIVMAQKVNADLRHMSKVANRACAISWEHPGIPGFSIAGSFFGANSALAVSPDGLRFCNESGLASANHVGVIPCAHAVFDEAAFQTTIYAAWNNAEKLADGTIVSAENLDELGDLLGLPQGSLATTVSGYNEFCAQGCDYAFGRPADNLVPLSETGPYYSFELNPTYVHTFGGPRRNLQCEVLDLDGNAIPGLYGAGECGSMWIGVYEGGAALGECMVSGRIAGAQAAKRAQEQPVELLTDAEAPAAINADGLDIELGDGETLGSAYGIGGLVVVKVTRDGDAITAVEVVHENETPGIGSKAVDALPAEMVEKGDPDVDIVSGATVTSMAITAAVKNALA